MAVELSTSIRYPEEVRNFVAAFTDSTDRLTEEFYDPEHFGNIVVRCTGRGYDVLIVMDRSWWQIFLGVPWPSPRAHDYRRQLKRSFLSSVWLAYYQGRDPTIADEVFPRLFEVALDIPALAPSNDADGRAASGQLEVLGVLGAKRGRLMQEWVTEHRW